MKIFGGVECMAGNKRLEFGYDSNHDADWGIFKAIFPVRDIRVIVQLSWLFGAL